MTCRARDPLPPLLAVGLVLLAGCTGWGSPISDPTATTRASPTQSPTATTAAATPSRPPDLDRRLYDLATAENRTAYADPHGLVYEDGSVQAVIELAGGRALPDGYGVTVELRRDGLVQGFVAVDDLVGLARHENVTAVRPPSRPQPT
ncbi:hypothetical protein [Halobellus rubicundus]|uniref:Uncharacterized protein n=1 Tax=Halobellus rubicundus TaxID=2996466 RepID=A0ABD5MCC2_9EURY